MGTVDFHPVVTSFLGSPGRLGVQVRKLVNLVNGQRPRRFLQHGNIAGGKNLSAGMLAGGLGAGVVNLGK